METVRIRDLGWKKVGSGINISDPPHCLSGTVDSCAFLWCRVLKLAACVWILVIFLRWCRVSHFAAWVESLSSSWFPMMLRIALCTCVHWILGWFHIMPRIIFCSLRMQYSGLLCFSLMPRIKISSLRVGSRGFLWRRVSYFATCVYSA